jgi:Flp pilus assembly protein TadG
MLKQPVRRTGERGVATLLWLGFLSLVFIILPMIGLAIDVGFVYSVRAKMQAAVDGSALAAARALNIGQTLASQEAAAQSNAVTWFNANFPSNFYGIASVTMSTSNVTVQVDPNNAQLLDVTVSATAQVNTFFMRWFGQNTVTVGATGNASRRTVVAMMVLDRSGSMCSPDTAPCDKTKTTLPCYAMINAAKQFTGSFAEGSDYIGLVSFSDNSYIHTTPVQDFQSVLGYSNSSGSSTGNIDNISCTGGTGTAEAFSVAYQALEQMNLPGALNIIVLETDGLPNTLTMSFYDSTNKVVGLTTTGAKASTCQDLAGKTYKNGGFNTAAVIPAWAGGRSLVSSPFSTFTGPPAPPYSSIPNYMVGAVASSDPNSGDDFWLMLDYFTTTTANNFNSTLYVNSGGVSNCEFGNGQETTTPYDIAWFPAADVFGNSTNPSYGYQTVTTDAKGHITQNGWSNFHNAVLNATDNAAYQARTNANIPVTVFTIGLGGNSVNGPPDPVLLQRMANDPNGDEFNSPAEYQPCAQETDCATWTPTKQTNGTITNPNGTFVYSPNSANLGAAFLRISSQVLRLSK